jgi:hypothetical protein
MPSRGPTPCVPLAPHPHPHPHPHPAPPHHAASTIGTAATRPASPRPRRRPSRSISQPPATTRASTPRSPACSSSALLACCRLAARARSRTTTSTRAGGRRALGRLECTLGMAPSQPAARPPPPPYPPPLSPTPAGPCRGPPASPRSARLCPRWAPRPAPPASRWPWSSGSSTTSRRAPASSSRGCWGAPTRGTRARRQKRWGSTTRWAARGWGGVEGPSRGCGRRTRGEEKCPKLPVTHPSGRRLPPPAALPLRRQGRPGCARPGAPAAASAAACLAACTAPTVLLPRARAACRPPPRGGGSRPNRRPTRPLAPPAAATVPAAGWQGLRGRHRRARAQPDRVADVPHQPGGLAHADRLRQPPGPQGQGVPLCQQHAHGARAQRARGREAAGGAR